jgi:hypothetical protein
MFIELTTTSHLHDDSLTLDSAPSFLTSCRFCSNSIFSVFLQKQIRQLACALNDEASIVPHILRTHVRFPVCHHSLLPRYHNSQFAHFSLTVFGARSPYFASFPLFLFLAFCIGSLPRETEPNSNLVLGEPRQVGRMRSWSVGGWDVGRCATLSYLGFLFDHVPLFWIGREEEDVILLHVRGVGE